MDHLDRSRTPRATRRPLDERARAKLLDAQKVECAAVHSAVVAKESAQAKLDAVIARHQVAIDETNHALGMAQAHLVPFQASSAPPYSSINRSQTFVRPRARTPRDRQSIELIDRSLIAVTKGLGTPPRHPQEGGGQSERPKTVTHTLGLT